MDDQETETTTADGLNNNTILKMPDDYLVTVANGAAGTNGTNGTNGCNIDRHADLVCVVGMACRLPGDIRSPSDLWNLLAQNKSAQGPVPRERFNMEAFYHPDGARAGVMDADGGYFLNEDVRLFENSFFGINAMEAAYMDPQQRKLLEIVFECFESTGLSMEDVAGTNTGVYVGNFTVDYQTMQTRDPDYMHRYNATGSGTAILSNRISHAFNLQGPSMTIDTACSSSIYCLHTAVSAIRNGECDGAIVAGANLITSPEQHLGTMKGGVLSPTSTCHTFDASADGYGRAEAVNAVYLKPLSSALRDGDKVWAVFRGTAINANGRTPGITQPSAKLQEKVIRKAYAAAGLGFDETDYVECHGTGTAVGDPIEVAALQACFGPRDWPLKIGSVKSNLGHSEAASGLTSLIKVAMAFEKGRIPPTHGVKKLNPMLELSKANMSVTMEIEDWPRQRRRASINSFGYGGANAHVIVESFDSYFGNPAPKCLSASNVSSRTLVIPVSSSSNRSLDVRLEQTKDLIRCADTGNVKNLAFTLTHRRPSLRTRGVLLAQFEMNGCAKLIEAVKAEDIDPTSMDLPFAFVFTGQGAQYPRVGKELFENNERFRHTIQELDDILQNLPSVTRPAWSIEQTLLDPPEISEINDVTRSQPVCTAIQIGLVNLLRAWGVKPSAVVGHSSGEIAAAYAAGFLDTREAVLTAYFRGFAVGKLTNQGAMIAAGLGAEAAEQLILEMGLQDDVCVACTNSPVNVTLSGSPRGAERLLEELEARKLFARKLTTGGRAYHSHLVKDVGEMYEALLEPHLDESLAPKNSGAKMFSSVGYGMGQTVLFGKQARKARYWRDNLEKSVQFSGALQALMDDGKRYHFVEVGPHTALKEPIKQICKTAELDMRLFPYSGTLLRGKDAELATKTLAGTLYLHGHKLLWRFVNDIASQDQVELFTLPPYPWDYSVGLHWYEPRQSVELRNRKHRRHELLGSALLAGNGIDWAWRNILRLQEAQWLSDHKIEAQIVFPAAGYLAMAVEAISQISGLEQDLANMTFEFRGVAIKSALVIQEYADAGAKETEIHTTMAAQKISNTSASDEWFDFAISSWVDSRVTLHCSGSIRLSDIKHLTASTRVENTEHFEYWTMGRWYEKLAEGGLCFGPTFQSLSCLRTDGNRIRTDAVSSATLRTKVGKATDTMYPVHPVTIDACLQAAIMGGTSGNLSDLKAFIPVFIAECRIQAGKASDEEATIHTHSTTTGFSNRRIDCTLFDAVEKPVVDMKNLLLSLYTGKILPEDSTSLHLERHPALRIDWKPDILGLRPDSQSQLDEHIDKFVRRNRTNPADSDMVVLVGALLDLVGHHKPNFRALEIGSGRQKATDFWLRLLEKNHALPRIRSWDTASLAEDDTIMMTNRTSGPFDAVVMSDLSDAERLWKQVPDQILSLLGDSGVIITPKTDAALGGLAAAEFTIIETRMQTILAVKQSKVIRPTKGKEALIVYRNPSPAVRAFASNLLAHLRKSGAAQATATSLADLPSCPISPKTMCISLLELEHEFLATMSPEEMNLLRSITDVTTDLLWLTGANILGNTPDPNLTLSSGLSRALMIEQPSLRYCILDLGPLEGLELLSTFDSIERALTVYDEIDDKEFVQLGGVLYTSRFVPDLTVNNLFRRRMRYQDPIQRESLGSSSPARLAISKPGITDTLHFQQIRETPTRPPAGFIDVEIKAVSLNAKDIYNVSGHSETKTGTSALEFCGIVKAVGLDVENVCVGDRVVVMAPNYFTTTERVPAWSAQRLLPGEDEGALCTIPIVYATALYALHDRGHLRAGESVLIHAGAGAFGTAAITVAKLTGATVYTTCSSEAKRHYLTTELGIPTEHIFSSRDTSFAEGIRVATGGRGVDLIVNSLVGDLMHASWDCLANFGRFVEIGKRELVDAGRLQMSMFLKNTTFTAFDLSELFYHEDQHYRDIWITKTREALELYRAGKIKPGPIVTYDVSEISSAFRAFSAKDRIGKVVISLQDAESQIPVIPAKYLTVFDPEKIYLLVGCLGGLGRSLSRWMRKQGARHFAFIGRSGDDKPTAKTLVDHLRRNGAEIIVIRGDVAVLDDVQAAVQACLATGRPIGGVVQAAVGLHEALFSRMSNKAWHTAMQPKWRGTWNLHNALEGRGDALDFFLLTSSVSGSVATATESNYCAANGFLDSWARWRRMQGKKAVSVGLGMISEVGYLHENPEIEALLLRKGIQPLNEEEFLQVLDLALSANGGEYEAGMPDPDCAHMLTGLESQALRNLAEKGWDVTSANMIDPRSAILAASLLSEMDKGRSSGVTAGLANAPAWLAVITPPIAKALTPEYEASTLVDAVLRVTRKRFSALILMPIDQIDTTQVLAQFGVDSMIAAEFRAWIWATFKVDIPFLDLLSNQKTLGSLADVIAEKLSEA